MGSMIRTRTMTAEELSDAELVARSLAGDRDAFSRIVSRYRTLICQAEGDCRLAFGVCICCEFTP